MHSCDYCGYPKGEVIVPSNGTYYLACARCYASFYTCQACVHEANCDFETNPSPIPKIIPQEIRQGNCIVQMPIKNPERVKLTCFKCKCFNHDTLLCNREVFYCNEYCEVIPSRRNDEEMINFVQTDEKEVENGK